MAQLPQDIRRALLRFLTSPSSVRTDVIRRLRRRGQHALVDTLVELDADASLRWLAVQALESAELEAIQQDAMTLVPLGMHDGPRR